MKWQRTLWPPFYISIIGNFAARTVSWAKQGRGKEANLPRCQGHTLQWDMCPILLPFPFCFINIESCFTKSRYELSARVTFCAENTSLRHIEFSELLCYCLLSYLLWRDEIRLVQDGFYEWCVVWAEIAMNKTRASLSLDRQIWLSGPYSVNLGQVDCPLHPTSNRSAWLTASSGETGEYISDGVTDAKRYNSFQYSATFL